jgi:hypothetical protein
VDVEDYISEFVESYDGELLKEGWWDNLKDKFKASRVGGAVTAAVTAGKEQAGLPKFKFDKAMAGLQALVSAVPAGVKGVRGQRDLQTVLNNLLQMLEKQRPAVDAVGPETKTVGFTAKDQADLRAKSAPTTSSTEAPVDLTGMEAKPKYVPQPPINVGAGIPAVESTAHLVEQGYAKIGSSGHQVVISNLSQAIKSAVEAAAASPGLPADSTDSMMEIDKMEPEVAKWILAEMQQSGVLGKALGAGHKVVISNLSQAIKSAVEVAAAGQQQGAQYAALINSMLEIDKMEPGVAKWILLEMQRGQSVKAENTDAEVSEKEYDSSKGSWYVGDDGNIVPNLPNDEEERENGFFGSW